RAAPRRAASSPAPPHVAQRGAGRLESLAPYRLLPRWPGVGRVPRQPGAHRAIVASHGRHREPKSLTHRGLETTVSEGFRFAVAAVARNDGAVRAWLPGHATYAWPTWEEPVWRERLKPACAALRDVWGSW